MQYIKASDENKVHPIIIIYNVNLIYNDHGNRIVNHRCYTKSCLWPRL